MNKQINDERDFQKLCKQKIQAGYHVEPSSKFWFLAGRRTLWARIKSDAFRSACIEVLGEDPETDWHLVKRPSHDPDTEAVFCAALCATVDPETIRKILFRYIELRDNWEHTLTLLGR